MKLAHRRLAKGGRFLLLELRSLVEIDADTSHKGKIVNYLITIAAGAAAAPYPLIIWQRLSHPEW